METKVRLPRGIDAALARRYVRPAPVCQCCPPFSPYRAEQAPIEPDPEGDRITAYLAKKYNLIDYEAYLKRLRAHLATNPPMRPWPVGHKPKTRNASAPSGKRWGHWEKGENNDEQ